MDLSRAERTDDAEEADHDVSPDEHTSARADREAAFHDDRFAHDGGVRRSSRFYSVAATSKAYFAEQIATVRAPARVLELGCGPDGAAWGLAAREIEVVGIDISDQAISLARAQAAAEGIDHTDFVKMNAESLEFDDASFDVVVGSSILHHLDLDRAIREIRRVLRPGGRALFYEPSGHNPAINLYRRLTPNDRSMDERPLTDGDVATLHAGFDSVDMTYFHLTSLAALPLTPTRYFDTAAGALERLDRRVMHRFERLQKYAWVIVIDAQVAGPVDQP